MHDKCTTQQMVSERLWEKSRRPYYNVYPAIAPMLVKLSLELDTAFIKPPLPVFCIRFPQEHPPLRFQAGGKDWHIRSILAGHSVGLLKDGELLDGWVLWVDTGERITTPEGREGPVHTYINLPLQGGLNLEDALHALPNDPSAHVGMVMPEEIRTACARLACTICLLENDPDLIEPEVLNKDEGKPVTREIIDRAKRRGKYGWNVGKGIEVVPHVRRPHLCLVHTGHGRTVAKIVKRKGSVIHRDVVEKVPTGYETGYKKGYEGFEGDGQ